MSTHTVWLVPHQQQTCVSNVEAIAEQLWNEGFFPYLDFQEEWSVGKPSSKRREMSYDYFNRRATDWKEAGKPLPAAISGPFEETWIHCRPYKFLIPMEPQDSLDFYCPRCQAKIVPSVYSSADCSFTFTYGAFVTCPRCDSYYPATELSSDLSKSIWAQFSISFRDYIFDSPMDEWITKLTTVIGPSIRIDNWHT
jgi:hypothetical protein